MKRLKQLKHRLDQVAGRRIRKLAGTLDPKRHEDRLKKLEDIESIRRLKAAYCAACDDDHDGEQVCGEAGSAVSSSAKGARTHALPVQELVLPQ